MPNRNDGSSKIERFAEAIIDALPFKLHIVDRHIHIVGWNRHAEGGIFGVKKCDAVGRSLLSVLEIHRDKVVSSKGMDLILEEFREVFEKGASIRKDEVSLLTSGEKRHYSVTKFPIYKNEGHVSHAVTMIEDVSERHSRDEKRMARERLHVLSHIAAGIAHEINNPLSSLSVCIERLQRELKENAVQNKGVLERFDEHLKIMEKEVYRCKGITTGLLNVAREQAFEKKPKDMSNVIIDALREFGLGKEPGPKVTLDIEDNLPLVCVNDSLLLQAFSSIIRNAFEAMPEHGGLLKVSLCKGFDGGGKVLKIRFEDNGMGMEEKVMTEIFNPFFTTKMGRTGLGLSTSYNIITEHNGKIEVESRKHKGSVFTVMFPLS